MPVANARASRIRRNTSGGTSPIFRSSRFTVSEEHLRNLPREGKTASVAPLRICFHDSVSSVAHRSPAPAAHRDHVAIRLRASLCGQAKISQPHFTGTRAHPTGSALPARQRASASHRAHRGQPRRSPARRGHAPPPRLPASICAASYLAFQRWRPQAQFTSTRQLMQPATSNQSLQPTASRLSRLGSAASLLHVAKLQGICPCGRLVFVAGRNHTDYYLRPRA